MLFLRHGAHVEINQGEGARRATTRGAAVSLTQALVRDGPRPPVGTPFDYLLPNLATKPGSHLPGDPAAVTAALNALGTAMVDDAGLVSTGPQARVNSTIPTIYTYWGQFIDHDLTANTDRDSETSDITKPVLTPVPPDTVREKLRNLRRPALDLDHLYGDGPALLDPSSNDAGFYDGARFRLGSNTDQAGIPGVKIPPEADLDRDLPRIGPLLDAGIITEDVLPEGLRTDANRRTRAFIGDLRNDENLIIAQLHLAFLRFHNAVVDAIEADPRGFGLQAPTPAAVFEQARQLTRWHHQWLILNDYLRTVTLPGIVDSLLVGGLKHYRPILGRTLFMPLEFSVAAFRFGHTMVRGTYDHNRNFRARRDGPGRPPVVTVATFDLLFLFTGGGFQRDRADPAKITRNPFGGTPTLPFNWIIEWDRFTDKADSDETHFARRIDTRLVPPLTSSGIINEGNETTDAALRTLLKHLARRNLLRGYLLSIPTGQSVAAEMGVPALTPDELLQGNSDALNATLRDAGFLEATPLWFYLLKEAEVRADGNSLGELGSRIVCETIIGVLKHDRNSFLAQLGGWTPADGVRLRNGDPIITIRDFLAFAGLLA